jgi:glutamine amidotransferase
MHNGFVAELPTVKRDLIMAVDESLYPEIAGQADTEILFYLALTFGLQDDPPDAVARTIGLVESVGRAKGVKYPFQGTIATTDGERTWAFRYSSEGNSRSLFYTGSVPTLRELYPERQVLMEVSDDARLIVSEPVGDLPGAWHEVPESSYGVVGRGEDELREFRVKPPVTAVPIGA